MTAPIRLPLYGLALVLLGQVAMSVETTSPAIRVLFAAAAVATLIVERSGIRIDISGDRARVFATVGIVGYVFFGISRLDFGANDPGYEGFLTGLIVVFSVHQLGAILRLGRGGGPGPVYVASAIQILGAANAQPSSARLPWLLAGWLALALYTLWRGSAPALAPARRRLFTGPFFLLIGIMLAIAGGLAWGLPNLQRVMQGLGTGSGTGFRDKVNLGAVKQMQRSSRPVLRIRGEVQAGMHLRALCLDQFVCLGSSDQWQRTAAGKVRSEVPRRQTADGTGYSHAPIPGAPDWSGPSLTTDIALERYYDAPGRPSPLGTASVESDEEQSLWGDGSGVILVRSMTADRSFRSYRLRYVAEETRSQGEAEPDDEVVRCLGEPGEVSPYIRSLAREVVGAVNTDLEVALCLERWFAASGAFRYSLEVPRRGYGVEDFLAPEGREGWCEYFASGMVLMLRAQGVPARYATGYLVGEWNEVGGYYVVRSWDAHAWVEAWIEGEGWCTFDPTAAGDRRVGSDATGFLAGLWDWLLLSLKEAWAALSSGNLLDAARALFGGLLRALWELLLQPAGQVVIATLLLLFVVRSVRRSRRRRESAPVDTRPREVQLLESAWRNLLARALAHGAPLRPGDSPRQVLAKLEGSQGGPSQATAEPLVELIYRCRYGGAPLDFEELESVTQSLVGPAGDGVAGLPLTSNPCARILCS